MKRIVCLFLTLVLLAGMLPAPARAEIAADDTAAEETLSEALPEASAPITTEFPESLPPETTQSTAAEAETAAARDAETQPVLPTPSETADATLPTGEPEAPTQQWISIDGSFTNPLYDGLAAPETPGQYRPLDEAPEQLTEGYVTEAEAISLFRQAFRERKTYFNVKFTSANLYSNTGLLFDLIFVHTGLPTEGDYLRWQWRSCDPAGSTYYRDASTAQYVYNFTLSMAYYTTAAQETAVTEKVNSLLNQWNLSGKSSYEKMLTVYNYICTHVTYDYTHLSDTSYTRKFSAYAALIDGTAVCQGYALLLYRLALELGVDCRFIGGTGNGGAHGWNILRMDDGLYYNADSTWDAGRTNRRYFLVCPDNFTDHVRSEEFDTPQFHSAYPMGTVNYSPAADKTCGDGLTYTLSGGTLTILGAGAMYDYSLDNHAPWYESRAKITAVVLPEGITAIGDYAFHGCNRLTDVRLPAHLTSLGQHAFHGCGGLTDIVFLSTPAIGADAFRNCTKLKQVIFWGDGFSGAGVFSARLTAYYPRGNDTWTAEIRAGFGENVTWLPTPCIGSMTHTQAADPAQAPTCTEDGLTEGAHCQVCGDILTPQQRISASGHDLKHRDAQAPTCTEIGWEDYDVCTRCDYTTYQELPALGHDPATDPGKAAACTEDGLTEGSHCSRCGTVFQAQTPIPALGHDFDSAHICTRCGLCGGSCGEGLSWTLADGLLTVTGLGAMDADVPWLLYRADIRKAVLEEGVRAIAAGAFRACTALEEISLPDGLRVIPEEAFADSALKKITLPESIALVENSAFRGCPLEELRFTGSAPDFRENALAGLQCTLRYPQENAGWAAAENAYGGNVRWLPTDYTIRALTLSQSYLLLAPEESVRLEAQADSALPPDRLDWYPEDPQILDVTQAGRITAKAVGSTYVIVRGTLGAEVRTARCRVDVTAQPQVDVHLTDDTLSCELYSKSYACTELLVLTREANTLMSQDDQVPQAQAVITDARFAQAALNRYFRLLVTDSRRLQIIPTEEALENAAALEKRYTGTVLVTVNGQERSIGSLNLSLKKTLPKLKAASLSFNAFYPGQALPVTLTGAAITDIQALSLPDWLTLEGGNLVLREAPPAKASAKAALLIETDAWAALPVTLSVSLSTKAPGVRLSASSLTLACVNSRGGALKLQCSSRNDTLEGLGVTGITPPEGWQIRDFDLSDGSFTLVPEGNTVSGSCVLSVTFAGTESTLPLKLRITARTPGITVRPTTVSLNSFVGDRVVIPLTASPADYRMDVPSWVRRDTGSEEALHITASAGAITVETTDDTKPGTTYRVAVSVPGGKEALITVKTLPEKSKTPTVTGKITGAIDLTFPESAALFTPAFRNYAGTGTLQSWTVTAARGKTLLGECTDLFALENTDGQYCIRAVGAPETDCTYTFSAVFALGKDTLCSCTARLPVKRTAVKLKLSQTSLTLNRRVGDSAAIDVTCTTKGVALSAPTWILVEPSGIDGGSIDVGGGAPLAIAWRDSRLQITVNPGAQVNTVYKVLLYAGSTTQKADATLTVKVTDTPVTATVKASGAIDRIRDGSAVTLVPRYRSCMEAAALDPAVTIESAPGTAGGDFTPVAQGLFRVTGNADGSFTVGKCPEAQPELNRKYRAKLTFQGGNPVYVSIPVKSGTASFSAIGTPVLYRADRFSRGTFRLSAKDETLNALAQVEFKNAAQAALFQLYDYGGGTYAIGFRDNAPANLRYPASVTLNLFPEGSASDKPSGTVTVKLSVR